MGYVRCTLQLPKFLQDFKHLFYDPIEANESKGKDLIFLSFPLITCFHKANYVLHPMDVGTIYSERPKFVVVQYEVLKSLGCNVCKYYFS